MLKGRKRKLSAALAIPFTLALVACSAPTTVDVPLTFQPTEAATETPFVPTPLPPGPETLIVCLADEPESLFIYHPDVLYGEASLEANTILQAIYDGPIDLVDYQAKPVILEGLPTIENGGVLLQTVSLAENEVFFNPASLQPENLSIGDTYLPQGCNASDCLATYTGDEVQMDQMVVEFTLQADIIWSDGQPLTASDSRFSYTLDRHGDLPTTKFLVDRTAEYSVMDERTIRWVGIPGYMDSDFQTNFWPPLPEHILGEIPVSELLDSEAVNRAPIGWGSFLIAQWEPGKITLTPNAQYTGVGRNRPSIDRLIFRFLEQGGEGAIQQILTNECDIVDETLLEMDDYQTAQDLRSEGRLEVWSASDAQIMRLDFNLSPVDNTRPAFFQDQRTRQAVANCIDRSKLQSMNESATAGLPTTYINVEHPAVSPEIDLVPYDPEAGRSLLDQIGWVLDEDNPESPRVAFGVAGMRFDTSLSVSLLTTQTDEMQDFARAIKTDLEACGIAVEVTGVPIDEMSAPWPDGSAFGRGYDLILWSWPEWISPLCEMFAGWEIPSSAHPFGVNASGYSSETYDDACQKLFLSIPGMAGYDEAVSETQQIFNQDLPGLPLFQPSRWIVSDNETCGVAIDGLPTSALWNLEMLDSGDNCP